MWGAWRHTHTQPGSSICARLGGNTKRVALVGMGAADKLAFKTWKGLGSTAASLAKTHTATSAAVALVRVTLTLSPTLALTLP